MGTPPAQVETIAPKIEDWERIAVIVEVRPEPRPSSHEAVILEKMVIHEVA
jgi:hypothetical protein